MCASYRAGAGIAKRTPERPNVTLLASRVFHLKEGAGVGGGRGDGGTVMFEGFLLAAEQN